MCRALPKTEKGQWIGGSILLALSALLLLALFLPLQNRLHHLRAELEKTRRELLETEETVSNLGEFTRKGRSALDEIASLYHVFPTEKTASTFIQQIYEAEKNSRVKVAKIDPRQARDYKGYRAIPMRISLRAPFDNLGAFLNRLETQSSFIHLGDIRAAADDKNPVPAITLTATAFTITGTKGAVPDAVVLASAAPKPIDDYNFSPGTNDPFKPKVELPAAPVTSSLTVTMILWDEKEPMAVVRAKGAKETTIVKVGQELSGEEIIRIRESSITVRKDGFDIEIPLRK